MQEGDRREAKKKGDELFILLDTDRDGSISQKELEEARSLLAGCTVDDLGAIDLGEFRGADNDGNGQVDKVEWNDFISSLIGVVGFRKFLACADAWIEFLNEQTDLISESLAVVQTPAGKLSDPKKKAASPKRRPSRVSTAPPASGSNEEAKAALKIQSSFRGNKARRTIAVKGRTSVVPGKTPATGPIAHASGHAHGHAHGHAPGHAPVRRPERKLRTVEDVWNLLCEKFAESSRKIELNDLVGCLEEMHDTGLDMDLATLVPMGNEDDAVPEILSSEELRHLGRILCGLDPENVASFSEEKARAELDLLFSPIDRELASEDQLREADDRESQLQAVGSNPKLTFPRFRRLLGVQADIMNIELQYVVSHLAWLLTGQFEMPLPLARRLMETCIPSTKADSDSLDTLIGMSSVTLLAYNGGLVDSACAEGLPATEVTEIYHNVCMEIAAQNHTGPDSVTLSGRTDFELLLQKIQQAMPAGAGFRSPLQMAVYMVSKAGDGRTLSAQSPAVPANATEGRSIPLSKRSGWK